MKYCILLRNEEGKEEDLFGQWLAEGLKDVGIRSLASLMVEGQHVVVNNVIYRVATRCPELDKDGLVLILHLDKIQVRDDVIEKQVAEERGAA